MIKKEANIGHSTVNVDNSNGKASYNALATTNKLCLKIMVISDQFSQPKFVKNNPQLAPSKVLTNAVPIVGKPATRSKV